MSITLEQIKIRHDLLVSVLDEKQYRLYLAAEAKALGWGGVSQVSKATGASRNTISSGLDELIRPPVPKPAEDVVEGKKARGRTRGRRLQWLKMRVNVGAGEAVSAQQILIPR